MQDDDKLLRKPHVYCLGKRDIYLILRYMIYIYIISSLPDIWFLISTVLKISTGCGLLLDVWMSQSSPDHGLLLGQMICGSPIHAKYACGIVMVIVLFCLMTFHYHFTIISLSFHYHFTIISHSHSRFFWWHFTIISLSLVIVWVIVIFLMTFNYHFTIISHSHSHSHSYISRATAPTILYGWHGSGKKRVWRQKTTISLMYVCICMCIYIYVYR